MSRNVESNDAVAKKRQLRNGLIKLVSIILASFIGVCGLIVGIMFLAGSFDPVVIYPTGINFEHELYEPTLEYDEDGNLINYFYIKVLGEPKDLTEKEINLSVGDSYVVTLEKTTAQIGEDIKVFITTEDGKLPNGGATTITARAGGSGIYGSDTCNVFIDRPVTAIEAQTSKKNTANSQSLYVNEVISVYEPTFYPARSKNPSKVDENQGDEIVSKPDKAYMYVLEFEFKQPGVDGDVYRWVDVDNLSDPANTESNRVVKWANANKTQIVALKEGKFRLLCHAFSTYNVQEQEITEETVEQKKVRMSICDGYDEEQIFTVTEVNLASLESKNYNATSTPLDFEYKKEYRLYLRSNSTIAQLAANRAYNVDIAINPQTGYGIDYTSMYDKVKDIYITTNLNNQDTIIQISGNKVVGEDNVTRIYPILDNQWESFPDEQKEYYYVITVIGKSSNFAFNFHIINPNDGSELATSVSATISEVATTEFNFNKGPVTDNDVTVSIDPTGDHTRNTMNTVIDPDAPFELNLYDYITNLAADGKEPTYDKILFYAYISNSTETFAENLANVSEVISITTTNQNPFILAQDRYGIILENGILKPIGYGEVTIYAALIQTDYEGNDVINAVTGTYAIKLASIKFTVETILKQVRVQIRENNSDEIVEEELKENYIYKLVLQPTYDGMAVDYKVLDRVLDEINIGFTTEEDGIAQIQIDSELTYDSINGYHYCLISIPSSSLKDYAKDLQCFIYHKDKLVGSSTQYTIIDTAVKSVKLIVESDDNTKKTDFVYKAEVSGGEIIWREVYTDGEGKPAVGGQFDFTVDIDGLNQNYNLTSSDPTAISIYSDNGLQKLKFIKPTNGFVTITCESVENSNIKDTIRIKLEESQFVFEAKNMTISNGEIYENNDTYVETVYRDYKVNVFNLVTVKFNGEVFNNLATLRFSSATSNAILANRDGENGLSTAGDVYFTHNVSSSEYITVEIVTTFGDILRYRFILRNNLAPTIEFKNVSNINSDPNAINQNQAVVSLYEGAYYMTMVYAQGNTINVKDLIALNHREDITKVFTNQLINNDLRFEVASTSGRLVTINSLTGVLNYSNSGLQRVTAPTLINITMYETDLIDKELGNVEGNTMRVYNYSFKVLLVPNILVETTTATINEEEYTIYQAGKYVFVNDSYTTEYNFAEVSGTVQNLEIPFANFFSIRNFRGDVVESPVVTYSIPDDSFASLTSVGVLISPDSIYVSSQLEIGLTYTHYIDYTETVVITINPYYEIGYNESADSYIKDGDDEYILIHVEQMIQLYNIVTIINDTTNAKKDSLTYHIHQTEYINIRESSNSESAYINGLKYSAGEYSYIDVYLDNKTTGFIIKIKVIENVDFDNYGVDEEYISEVLGEKIVVENEVEYWEAYAKQELDLLRAFIATKYTAKDNNLSMIYSFHIYQEETDTYIEDINNNYIQLSTNIITFKEVAETTKILIRAKAEQYDEENGVVPLEFMVEIQKSQGWQWTYPIKDNNINELDFDRQQLLTKWNDELINGVNSTALGNVLFNESYEYKDINYRELQPNDTFNVSDVLSVYNIVKDPVGDTQYLYLTNDQMLEFVNIDFVDYDFDSNSWVTSTHITRNGNVVVVKDNISVPTLTFMVVTSDNGMLDVYKLYILTKETVNSKENIVITIAYPTNSSNYYLDDTDNKYELINLTSKEGEFGIKLTSVEEGGNGTRRISASLNSQDVTSTLRFKVYAEVLDLATNTFSKLPNTYFQPTIENGYLKLKDGNGNDLPKNTRITISIYNSYESDFGVYYYVWIGDDLLVNFNDSESTVVLSKVDGEDVITYNYGYRNEFIYSDGNLYNIKDYITFTRLDGSEIANENIEYYIAEVSDFVIENNEVVSYGSDENLTKQSTLEIVLIQDATNGGQFAITRFASNEGTAIVIKCKIYLSEDKQEYTIAYYPIIVKSSGVEFSNPDGSVNSQSNPYVVSYNSSVGSSIIYNLYKEIEGSPTTTFIDILSIAELIPTLEKNLSRELALDLDYFGRAVSNDELFTFLDPVYNADAAVADWLKSKEFTICRDDKVYDFSYGESGIVWTNVENNEVSSVSLPRFSFSINHDVTEETLVTLSLTPRWVSVDDVNEDVLATAGVSKPTFNYYIKVVPEYKVDVSSTSKSANVYSYHEYDVLNETNAASFIFSRFNNEKQIYEEVDVNDVFNAEDSKYKLVVLNEYKNQVVETPLDLLSFNGSNITFKGVLAQEKVTVGIMYNEQLMPNVYMDFYINHNFTTNDVSLLNSDGTANSETNTYNISNEVLLSDVLKLDRFVDDNLALAYLDNSEIEQIEILKTFTYTSSTFGDTYALSQASEDNKILQVEYDKIKVNSNFLTAESYNANLTVSIRGVYLTTIYFTVQSNYSFAVNNTSTTAFIGQEIDLTNLGKGFVGNDGSELVGGEMTFKALNSNNVTLDADGKVSFSSVGEYKILVTYTKGSDTYIGTIDFIVQPKYIIDIEEDFIVSENANGLTDAELLNNFKFYYEGELIETPSGVVVNKQNFSSLSEIFKISVTFEGVSSHYYLCSDSKYYKGVDADESVTVTAGGNTVELIGLIDTLYDINNNEIRRNESVDVAFYSVNNTDLTLLSDRTITTEFELEGKLKEIIYKMQATDGEYYYGLITLTVLPSYKVNAIYNNPSQQLTTVAVGEKINIHEQISYTTQDGLDNALLASSLKNNTTRNYVVTLFDTQGREVSNKNAYMIDSNGEFEFKIDALNYTALVAYSFVYAPVDENNNVIATYNIPTIYYQILVRSVDYHFVSTGVPTYQLGEEFKIDDFGNFNITGDKYLFDEIGNYYTIENNVIISSNVLYDTECEVLITLTKKIDGKTYTYSTIQKFILKQTYNVEYNVQDGNIVKTFTKNVFGSFDEFAAGSEDDKIGGGTTGLINARYFSFNDDRRSDIINIVNSITVSTFVDNTAYNHTYNFKDGEIIDSIADSVKTFYNFKTKNNNINFYTLYNKDSNKYPLDGCTITFLIKFKTEDQTKFIDFTVSYNTITEANDFNFIDGSILFDYDNNEVNISKDSFQISDVANVKIVASSNCEGLTLSSSVITNSSGIKVTAKRYYGANISGKLYFDLYNADTDTYVKSCSVSINITGYDIKLKDQSATNNLNDKTVKLNDETIKVNEFDYSTYIYKLTTTYLVYDYTGNKVDNNDNYINVSNKGVVSFRRPPNGKDYTLIIVYKFTLNSGKVLDNFTEQVYTKQVNVTVPISYEITSNLEIKNGVISLPSNKYVKIQINANYEDSTKIIQNISGWELLSTSNVNADNILKSYNEENTALELTFDTLTYSAYAHLIVESDVDGYLVELTVDISIPTTLTLNQTITTTSINYVTATKNRVGYSGTIDLQSGYEGVEVYDADGKQVLTGINYNVAYNELTIYKFDYIYAVKYKTTFNNSDSYYYEYYTLKEAAESNEYIFNIKKSNEVVNGIYLNYNQETGFNIQFSKQGFPLLNYKREVIVPSQFSSYLTVTFSSDSANFNVKSIKNEHFTAYITIKVSDGGESYEKNFEVYASSRAVNDTSADRSVNISIPDDYLADTYNVDLSTFTNAGYQLKSKTNSSNVTISNGVVRFKVPYYTYTVNTDGSVSRSGNNSYSETINVTQTGSSIQLNFTITKNVAALTSSYTLNLLPTKVLVLDDIELNMAKTITNDDLKYNGNKLNGTIKFIPLNNINYEISSGVLTIVRFGEFYCLVEQNDNGQVTYYLQKFIVTVNESRYAAITLDRDIIASGCYTPDETGGNVGTNNSFSGLEIVSTFKLQDDKQYYYDLDINVNGLMSERHAVIEIDAETDKFSINGVANTDVNNKKFIVDIPYWEYSSDDGRLTSIAPINNEFVLVITGDNSTHTFNVTVRNTYTCAGIYNNNDTVTLNELSTNNGVVNTSDLVVDDRFMYGNDYIDNNGKLKGTVEFVAQSGSRNVLSNSNTTMTFYETGNKNLIVKQTLTNGTTTYYVVSVNIVKAMAVPAAETVTNFKYQEVPTEYVVESSETSLAVSNIVNTVLGGNVYNSSTFKVLANSINVSGGSVVLSQSAFDKYAYLNMYCTTNTTYYRIKIKCTSSGATHKTGNTVIIDQATSSAIYDAFNKLAEGETTTINDEVLSNYIYQNFGRNKINSITRNGNSFVIKQYTIFEYSNTIVLQKSVNIVNNNFVIKIESGKNSYDFKDTIYTPISGPTGVTISGTKLTFAPVLTDTEVLIKIKSSVNGATNVQYVKFILMTDSNMISSMLSNFATIDVVKGKTQDISFADTTNYTYKSNNRVISSYTFSATYANSSYGAHEVNFKVFDKYGNSIELIKIFNVIAEGSEGTPITFKQNVFSVDGTSVDLKSVISTTGGTPTFSIIENVNGKVSVSGSVLSYNFYHFESYTVKLKATIGSSSFEFYLVLESNLDTNLVVKNEQLVTLEPNATIDLFKSNFDAVISVLNVSVSLENSSGETITSYSYSDGELSVYSLRNGDYVVNISVTDNCNVTYLYTYIFNVNEATSQSLQYIANTVVINAGETLTLTKDTSDDYADIFIGTFKLLAATIDGIDLSEVCLNDLSYVTFELNYNGSELTVSDLCSITAGHVLYDTTVQVEVTLKDGISEYIGYLNVMILGDYTFESNVDDNFRVDFESDFLLSDLIAVKQNGNDITTSLNSVSSLATTISIIDYVENEVSDDITYDEDNQIFRVSSKASGKVYIARLSFSTNDQVRVVEFVINVNEKTYTFNLKSDMYTIYSGESINLNNFVGQFVDNEGYVVLDDGSRAQLTFALDDVDDEPFVTLFEGNTLKANSVLETTIVRIKVMQGESYVGYLNITILPHFEASINIVKDEYTTIENNIIKLKANSSVKLIPSIVDTLNAGSSEYSPDFAIDCVFNGNIVSGFDGNAYVFNANKEYIGKTCVVEFIISVKYNGDIYQQITLTQNIYVYDRIIKFIGVNNSINNEITTIGLDVTSLFELYYENDMDNKLSISFEDYDVYFNTNNGLIELDKSSTDFTYVDYNNNQIGYTLINNILMIDTSSASSNILLNIKIVDAYTGDSITYSCIIVCA